MCHGSHAPGMILPCESSRKHDGESIEQQPPEMPCFRKNIASFRGFLSSMLLLVLAIALTVILTMVTTYKLLDDGRGDVATSVTIGIPSTIGNVSKPTVQQPSYDVLRYSKLDPGDVAEKSKIRQILEGTENDGRRQGRRYNWMNARFDHVSDHYEQSSTFGRSRLSHRRSAAVRGAVWPPELSHPRFGPHMTKFRELLQAWARKKRYDPSVMKELLSEIKAPIDRHFNSGMSEKKKADVSEVESEKVSKKGSESEKVSEKVSKKAEKNESDIAGSEMESEKKYRTCAVVGNSGILLNREHGAFIDGHEIVIRLNGARVRTFEKWVGSRTTISFVNSNILHTCARRQRCSCHTNGDPLEPQVPMVSYICQVAHLMDVAYCETFRKAPLLVTDPRFDSLATRIVRYYSLQHFFLKHNQDLGQGPSPGPSSMRNASLTSTPSKTTSRTTSRILGSTSIGSFSRSTYEEWSRVHDGAFFHYSSGMQAVMLALGICEQVDIFGFGKVAQAKHHYHSNQKAELSLHDYEAEYEFYDDLVAGRGRFIPFLNESGIVLPRVQVFR